MNLLRVSVMEKLGVDGDISGQKCRNWQISIWKKLLNHMVILGLVIICISSNYFVEKLNFGQCHTCKTTETN